MGEESDSQLLARTIRDQDQAAFAQLFDRFKNESYSLALHLTHNAALAEDAVQDAMLAVWQLKMAPDDGVRKWLLAIVANKSLQLMRSRKRSSQREERKVDMSFDSCESAPESKHEREELIGTLRQHMGKLPPVERQMLALYFGAELPETEIGKMLSLSQTSVSRKLNEALARLRANLASSGFAAAVPLVALKGLNQALLSGHDAPLRLSDKVFKALTTKALKPSQRLSRRSRSVRKNSSVSVAGAAVLFVAVGLVGWAALPSAPRPVQTAIVQPAKPVTPPPVPAAVPIPTPVPAALPVPTPVPVAVVEKPKPGIQRSWSFDAGPANDLLTFNGTWKWKKQGNLGVMDAAESSAVIVPLPIQFGSDPVMIDVIRNGIGRKGAACVNTHWIKDQALLPYQEYNKPRTVDIRSSATRIYILGRYIVTLQGGLVSGLCVYEKAFPSDALCLLIQNFSVESIHVRSIDAADIPAELRDVPAVIRELGPETPGRNSGLVLQRSN